MRIHALALTLLTAAILAPSIQAQQPTYYARTIAGVSSNGDGGQARVARVLQPTRVTTDANGNIYIVEALGRIRRVATDGVITSWGSKLDGTASGDGGQVTDATFTSLFGATVSGNSLYISQRTPCNIRRVNLTTGVISNFAGNGTCSDGADGPALTTSLNFPGALAADSQGRLYVTENTRVRRIDPVSGTIVNIAGTGTAGYSGDNSVAIVAQLNTPQGVAVDANGVVYVSDTANCRVRRVLSNIISTVAGSPVCGTLGDGSSAILAQLNGNADLALDSTGTQLYIASGSTTVRRLQIDTGIIDRYAGTGLAGMVIQENLPPLLADLRSVTGVHIDAAGNILLVDNGANRIVRTGSNGLMFTVAGGPTYAGDGGPAQYGSVTLPVDVLAEPNGKVLISENINRVLRRFNPPGTLSTVAGSGAPTGASGNGGAAISASVSPVALARDADGDIFTADALSNTIRKVGVNGAISQVGPVFSTLPGGVAVDPTERYVYASLPSLHRIVRISLATDQASVYAGTGAITDAGTSGFSGDGGAPTSARLNSPQRLAVDADGNLYFADSGNHRIRRINAAGDRIDTVAGNGTGDFSGDGNLALQASLPNPVGVAVDTSGNLLVSNATSIFRVEKSTGRLNRIAGGTTRGTTPSLGIAALQARFNGISNVTVDERGIIYFAETTAGRVIAMTPASYTTPTISGIIAPGTFGAGSVLTPGGWVEIYGEKLADTTRAWKLGDFIGNISPITLDGISVKIGGIDAFVQSISPTQINAVVPDGVPNGNAVIEVTNTRGLHNVITAEPIVASVATRAPYLLAPPAFARGGRQYVTAILPGGAFAGPPGLIPAANFRAARSGDRVVVYGVGFGSVSPNTGAGYIAAGLTALPNVRIKIGGIETPVDYAGLAAGYVGLYQFNFQMPSAPTGDQRLEITTDGLPLTQTLYLLVE